MLTSGADIQKSLSRSVKVGLLNLNLSSTVNKITEKKIKTFACPAAKKVDHPTDSREGPVSPSKRAVIVKSRSFR